MSARRVTPRKPPHWVVYRIHGARGSMLGVVAALDDKAALAAAFEEFGIPEADRKRIIVQPTNA